jgi:hypothetical protein
VGPARQLPRAEEDVAEAGRIASMGWAGLLGPVRVRRREERREERLGWLRGPVDRRPTRVLGVSKWI